MMSFRKMLAKMPQLISPTDFGLKDAATNRSLATRLLKKKVETIDETADWILFRAGDDRKGNIAMISKGTEKIVYLVHYERRVRKGMGTFVTQLKLWRDERSPWVVRITDRIFFDYLLKKYGAIMSDAQQTPDGRSFWIRRMSIAAAKGMKVGIADMNARKIRWFEGPLNTF